MLSFRVAALVWTTFLVAGGTAVSTAPLQAGAPDLSDVPAADGGAAGAVRGGRIEGGPPFVPRPLLTATESDTLLLLPRLTMPIASAGADARGGTSAAKPIAAARTRVRQAPASPEVDMTTAVSTHGPALHARMRAVAKEHLPAVDDSRFGFSAQRIAHIRRALKLRPDQQAYWPPVEAILRDIARDQGGAGHGLAASKAAASAASIAPDKLQQLTSAAIPLIMSLDDTQKREARALARSMGLDEVASAI